MPVEQPTATVRLTPRLAWQLAAPHTWPAAIMPAFVAVACAAATGYEVSVHLALILLAISISMQAAVNAFNDYYDYVKGADSVDDNVEVSDAVLVYNNIDPASARNFAIGLLAVAFALGGYVIYRAGWIPLAIGVVGALFVVLYSAGKTPVSYLPLGEAVSGIVMGGLIPLACYQALTGTFSWLALLWAVPTVIGVGLIMLTNNTCDVEKDVDSHRKTLSVLLGRERARTLYHALVLTWLFAITLIVALFFTQGLVVLPFMLLAAYPLLKALWSNPFVPASRIAAMSQICNANVCLGAFYAAAIFADSGIVLLP